VPRPKIFRPRISAQLIERAFDEIANHTVLGVVAQRQRRFKVLHELCAFGFDFVGEGHGLTYINAVSKHSIYEKASMGDQLVGLHSNFGWCDPTRTE
jgi:hypothetical protein